VDVRALGPLREIGSGGQARVMALVNHIDGPVYKEYNPRFVDDVDVDALRKFVAFGHALDEREQNALLSRVAWPEAIVRKNGVVSGFVMRRVPAEYRVHMRFGEESSEELALVQYLLNPAGYLAARGLSVGDPFRVEFLRDTAETLELFHRLGIAVGDLSPNNLLFSQTARPRCFFIDCDSMALDGVSVMPQVETPDWQVRMVGDEEPGTRGSDMFKFGLLTVRLFAGDQQTREPAAVPRALLRPVRRSLAAEPGRRPSPRTWMTALDAAQRRVGAATVRPEAVPVQPSPRATQVADATRPAATGPVAGWAVAAAVLIGALFVGTDSSTPVARNPSAGLPVFTTRPLYPLPTAYIPPRLTAPALPLPTGLLLPDRPVLPVCGGQSEPDVRGGPGLASARAAVGGLICSANAGEPGVADPLLANAPYFGIGSIVGFWGEGSAAPRATVRLSGWEAGCWQTSVRFTADYEVAAVGPLSRCG
jgi:hypothetical protein